MVLSRPFLFISLPSWRLWPLLSTPTLALWCSLTLQRDRLTVISFLKWSYSLIWIRFNSLTALYLTYFLTFLFFLPYPFKQIVHTIPVGSQPDSVAYTKDGKYVVVGESFQRNALFSMIFEWIEWDLQFTHHFSIACEGQPSLPNVPDDFYVDPEGLVYVIQMWETDWSPPIKRWI